MVEDTENVVVVERERDGVAVPGVGAPAIGGEGESLWEGDTVELSVGGGETFWEREIVEDTEYVG